jgi:hypothetical protein
MSTTARQQRLGNFEHCLPLQPCFAVADVYLQSGQPFRLEPAVVIFGRRYFDRVHTLIATQHPDAMHLIMAVPEPDSAMFRGFEHYMSVRANSRASHAGHDRFRRAFSRTLMNLCDELDLQTVGEQVLLEYRLWQRDDGISFGEWNSRRSKQRRANDDDYRDLPLPLGQALLGCVAAAVDSGKADDAFIALLNELAHAHLGCSLHRYKRIAQ